MVETEPTDNVAVEKARPPWRQKAPTANVVETEPTPTANVVETTPTANVVETAPTENVVETVVRRTPFSRAVVS